MAAESPFKYLKTFRGTPLFDIFNIYNFHVELDFYKVGPFILIKSIDDFATHTTIFRICLKTAG